MAFFQSTDDDDQVLADINVTPLVDVMLVLLIIFMITTPILHQGIEVTLPQTESQSLPVRNEDPLVLTITADDLVYVQDEPIHKSQLAERLTPMLEVRGDESVFLKGDREVAYGSIIEVIELLNDAGIFRVSLVTEPLPQRRGRG